MKNAGMITPELIRQKALKWWTGPDFLRSVLEGRSLFPRDIPFAEPGSRYLSAHFQEMKDWLGILHADSKEVRGHGYSVDFVSVNHRILGPQKLPVRIFIDSDDDFLTLTGKHRECARFRGLAATILAAWPVLGAFLAKNPHLVLAYADCWDRLLAVCRYFVENPRPAIYLRQLDIPGVDTKFIETHREILAALLDITVTSQSGKPSVQGLSHHGFERRFGLRHESPLVRFRLLDPSLAIGGLLDITIPVADFEQLSLPVERVFIIENKTNGLCFPDCPAGMAVFGLGYGIGALFNTAWLNKVALYYWGDIDTHGFAMLDKARGCFPMIKSFLMDRETLDMFRHLQGRETVSQRFTGVLERLASEERLLFEALRDNKPGHSIRLEQERIAYGYLVQRLRKLV